MNILKGDKLVLIREFDKFKTIGQCYEVVNIADEYVVLRDCETDIPVCSVNFADLDKYFKKESEKAGWTNWTRMINPVGDTIAEYRTNFKCVEVRILNDMLDYPNGKVIRSTAMCSQGDDFDLAFGIHLAYLRCEQKYLKNEIKECSAVIDEAQERIDMCESRIVNNKSVMKRMLEYIN